MQYVITKKFSTKAERTDRVIKIAEAFGLGIKDEEFIIYEDLKIDIDQGDVVYITGQSGSGKSLILKDLLAEFVKNKANIAHLDWIDLKDVPLIDDLGKNIDEALKLFSLAGLNDAYLWIRKPSELSDGQRYRYKIAKAIEQGAEIIFADEFTNALDRTTAKVVAHSLQKLAREQGITLIVATAMQDLRESLQPDVFIEKYYREKLFIEHKK